MANTPTMYNQDVKNEFLKQYPESTQATYKRIFEASAKKEWELKKDMYDWNAKEVTEFLYDLKPMTFASSRTNGRIVSAYIYWAIEKGLRETNDTNPLSAYKPQHFEKFVAVNVADYYITEQELRDIEGRLVNAQDSAILRLLFEGVQGTGCSELCNLKKEDIQGNVLRLTDSNGNERYLSVSNRCVRLVERASTEKEYYKSNGQIDDPNGTLKETTTLVDNPFVFRNSTTRTDKYHEAVDKHTLYRRIDMAKKWTDSTDYLTVKNVVRSGMLHFGAQLLREYGVLDKPQYEMIAKKFGVTNWWRVQEYVTKELISSKYPEVTA